MNKKDLVDLLQRYERMLIDGQSLYFDADEYDYLAEYYDRSDDLEQAKEVVAAGLSIHPNNELLMLRNVRFYMYDSQYVEALDYMNAHFTTYDYDLYLLKIECCLHLGLYAEAYSLTKVVLEDSDSDLDVTLSELGLIYLESNYIKEGVLYLEKSLEYNPHNEEVLSDLAYAYESIADYEKAIVISNKLIDIDPYNVDFWLFIGKLYTQVEEYEKAIDAFDFVSTIDGDDVAYLKLKAHCLVLIDRIQEAIVILQECLNEMPSDEYLYISLIDCYLSLEEYDAVIAIVERYANAFEEKSPILLAKEAYAYKMLDHDEKAYLCISSAIALDSSSLEVNIIALDLYVKLNLFSQAQLICEAILEERDGDIDILEKAVSISVQLQDLEDAISYQEQIVEIENTSNTLQKLALLYLENNSKELFFQTINSFSDDVLKSFFYLFYDEDLFPEIQLKRDFMIAHLMEAYNCRLLYKQLKY